MQASASSGGVGASVASQEALLAKPSKVAAGHWVVGLCKGPKCTTHDTYACQGSITC